MRQGMMEEPNGDPRLLWPAVLAGGHGSVLQNIFHGGNSDLQFLVLGVEMGRESYSRLGSPIDEDLPLQQLPTDPLGIRHVDGHRASPYLRIPRRVDLPAVPVGKLDQPCGLTFRFLPDARNSSLGDDSQAGARRFKGWHMRRSIHEAEGRLRVTDRTGLKGHGILMGEPACKPRFETLPEIRADVEVSYARPAAQPLENPAAGEVDA